MLFIYFFSLEIKVSNVLSICVALVVNFIVSRKFVFRDEAMQRTPGLQALKYTILVVVNMGISTSLLVALVNGGWPEAIAKLTVTVIIAAWTYFMYRTVIFKNHPTRSTLSE